jgi:hypothetical protein
VHNVESGFGLFTQDSGPHHQRLPAVSGPFEIYEVTRSQREPAVPDPKPGGGDIHHMPQEWAQNYVGLAKMHFADYGTPRLRAPFN